MMVAVAIAAGLLAADRTIRRITLYRHRAIYHAESAESCIGARAAAIECLRVIESDGDQDTLLRAVRRLEGIRIIERECKGEKLNWLEVERRGSKPLSSERIMAAKHAGEEAAGYFAELSKWHAAVRKNYEHAANCPWLPVTAQPP